MSLSKILSDVERMNWSKGPAALEILTNALYDYTRDTWKEYLTTWSKEEQDYIGEFIDHAKWNWFAYRGKAWKCRCPNILCTRIMSRILQKHQNPRSKNLNWNIKSLNLQLYVNYRDFFWEFAKMYMFYGTEETKETFTCPEDTDIVLILKMMKNCTLFILDDNYLYDTVVNCRNSFMHASHYKMSTKGLEDCVNAMKSLLEAISEKDNVLPEHKMTFSLAHRELVKLVKENIRMDMSKEELDIIINALKWQQKSIKSDLQHMGIPGQTSGALNEILKASKKQIKQYTIIIKTYQPILKIDDPNARRKALEAFEEKARQEENERYRREEGIKRNIEKRQREEEERKINDEVNRRLKEELEKMRNKTAPKQDTQDDAHVAGAAIGGTIGLVGGPIGAAVGGVVGSFVGGLMKGNK